MQQSPQIELTEKLYLDVNGALCYQHPFSLTRHRSLSHTARTRANNVETVALMQVITGLDNEQLTLLVVNMAMQWLGEHTGCDEQNLYMLMADRKVIGWWKNHWYNRDEAMTEMIVHFHMTRFNELRLRGNSLSECRRKAQLETLQKYNEMHKMAMDSRFYHYRQLEDSYAKLW